MHPFARNSETEIEKTSNRSQTGSKDTNPKTYKRGKEIPSWISLD